MTQEIKQEKREKENTVRELPVLPSQELVLFPHMVVPWIVDKPNLIRLIDDTLATDRTIAVATVQEVDDDNRRLNLNPIATMALILRMAKNEEGHAKLILQGISRVRILELTGQDPYLKAKVEPVEEQPPSDMESQAIVVNIRQLFSRVLELSPHLPSELGGVILNIEDPGTMADIAVSHLNIPKEEKQAVLEAVDVRQRLHRAFEILTRQLEILELGHKIQTQVRDQVDRSQKEFYLREQLKAIKRELGEDEETPDEIRELREALESKGLPEPVMEEAVRELDRLAKMHPSSSEYTVSRTYIDWILDLPWNEVTEDHLDLERAQRILDEDHYGLEKIKKRILEYLAVRKLKPDSKGPILCFAGPPGTGKTSLGRSIARALGRKFLRISLGGMRDEAEIRGHRRTYVGAMPGRIIQGLKKVGVKNPVFMLDEIDKLGMDFRGDPASALLEVLDPEQNSTFTDHYLGVEFDLSQVIFIATANVLDTIPGPLLDRMEVLELSGYTPDEKLEIARRYLLPRQLEEHGLTRRHLTIVKRAMEKIILEYTREAGVRDLERKIAAICRAVARKVASGETDKVVVKVGTLKEYLGHPLYRQEVAERTRIPGVVTGLAWTPAGGDILFIEATKMKGKGKLILTGKLGDVMKESAQAALSYVRSKAEEMSIDDTLIEEHDIHIHVPSGAIPKDGPSAGIAICTALVSLLTERPIKERLAMTGEITLRGQVLPVGGIKEKVLAAHRAGIREIILPKRNRHDLEELPEAVREAISFHLVDHMDEVIRRAFPRKGRGRE